MKLLLDTHAFIWWDSESSKLSPQALAFCQDRANTVLLSVASIWEMQIKLQLIPSSCFGKPIVSVFFKYTLKSYTTVDEKLIQRFYIMRFP